MPKKADIKSSNEFKIAETESFTKKVHERDFKKYYSKIYDFVYSQLKINPYFGPNIKKLKGEFESMYRYRIGNIRLFYTINNDEVVVLMIDIEKRKDAYK